MSIQLCIFLDYAVTDRLGRQEVSGRSEGKKEKKVQIVVNTDGNGNIWSSSSSLRNKFFGKSIK